MKCDCALETCEEYAGSVNSPGWASPARRIHRRSIEIMKRYLVLLTALLLLLTACGSSVSPSPTPDVTQKPAPSVTPAHIARLIIGAPIQDFVSMLGAPAKVLPANPNKVYYFQPNPSDENQYHYQVIVGKGKDGEE